MKPKLIVVGAAGRMGKRILALANEDGNFDIFGAVEKQDHPDIGKDAGLVAGIEAIDVTIDSAYPSGADIVIEFSLPDSADNTIDYCIANKTALVLGTTGLSDAQHNKIKSAAEQIPVIYGTNMGVGMNVMFALVSKAATLLGDQYDIEIIEQHHRFKKDAPSGSALTLAENICLATGRDYPGCIVHGRSGKDALREKGTIGMHAIRAGDITGEHSVIFGTLGEKITLNHSAHSRDTFVRGAIRAAKWLNGKKAGQYTMADVLSIR